MRSICQDNAKPMSTRIWEFCRVKVGWVSRVVGGNAKPMSRIRAADVKISPDNAKPMPRRRSCWCDFVTTRYMIWIQFPINAKPMSR